LSKADLGLSNALAVFVGDGSREKGLRGDPELLQLERKCPLGVDQVAAHRPFVAVEGPADFGDSQAERDMAGEGHQLQRAEIAEPAILGPFEVSACDPAGDAAATSRQKDLFALGVDDGQRRHSPKRLEPVQFIGAGKTRERQIDATSGKGRQTGAMPRL
jgi:hypothetical protein